MFRKTLLVFTFLIVLFPRVSNAGAPTTDVADLVPLLVETFQEAVRNKSINLSLDKSDLMEKALGFLPTNLFDGLKKSVDLKTFSPILPANLTDIASHMVNDPEAKEEFVGSVVETFRSGNVNEVAEKRNQMANIMRSMSYGYATSALESTNEMREAMDDLIEEVNSCAEIDCTVKHANKLDVIYNNMLAKQLILITGDAEKSGFASLISTSSSK